MSLSDRHKEIFSASAQTGTDPENLRPQHPKGAYGELEEDYPGDRTTAKATYEGAEGEVEFLPGVDISGESANIEIKKR